MFLLPVLNGDFRKLSCCFENNMYFVYRISTTGLNIIKYENGILAKHLKITEKRIYNPIVEIGEKYVMIRIDENRIYVYDANLNYITKFCHSCEIRNYGFITKKNCIYIFQTGGYLEKYEDMKLTEKIKIDYFFILDENFGIYYKNGRQVKYYFYNSDEEDEPKQKSLGKFVVSGEYLIDKHGKCVSRIDRYSVIINKFLCDRTNVSKVFKRNNINSLFFVFN